MVVGIQDAELAHALPDHGVLRELGGLALGGHRRLHDHGR
jgi:hypothetical protein